MTKDELESLLRILDIWVIVFGILPAIGVTGEAVVGFMHFRRSGQLQRLQASENFAQAAEIERLRGESASVRSDTARVMERVANAETQAANAGKELAVLQTVAAEAKTGGSRDTIGGN